MIQASATLCSLEEVTDEKRIRHHSAVTHAYDPELVSFVAQLGPPDVMDIAAARANTEALLGSFNDSVDTSGIDVVDREIAGPDGNQVPIRIYAPGEPAPAGGRPALLDIHGGGFISGSMAMSHAFGVHVARRLDAVVVTVEYRLAPEHPFPAGVEDCYAALRWLHDNASALGVDTTRVAVGGQSAGGGLSAAVALLARDRNGPPLCFQFLGIPELDHRLETASMRAFVDTPMWHRANAVRSWECYLGGDADRNNVSPYASPAVAEDVSGLPPAYITAMEFDPLRDEGILYALRLMEAGVSVELHCFPGTFHGSGAVVHAEISKRAHRELMTVLQRAFVARDER
jgi:acetyl esterase